MKQINAWEEVIHMANEDYTVIMTERNGTYELFLEKPHYAMQFMFGLPTEQQSKEEAFDLGIANAPDYVDMFDED